MGWYRAGSHDGTEERWATPAGAYQEGGLASHDILSGHWSDPGFIDWSDWLLLQFDDTYTSTTIRWYVSWIYGAVKVGLHLQYTVNGELVSQEVPAFPTLQEITFAERGVTAIGIRYGSAYTFPRNQIEPRIHGPYSAVSTDLLVLNPTGIVSAEAFGTPAIAAVEVEVALGRTYFFLA